MEHEILQRMRAEGNDTSSLAEDEYAELFAAEGIALPQVERRPYAQPVLSLLPSTPSKVVEQRGQTSSASKAVVKGRSMSRGSGNRNEPESGQPRRLEESRVWSGRGAGTGVSGAQEEKIKKLAMDVQDLQQKQEMAQRNELSKQHDASNAAHKLSALVAQFQGLSRLYVGESIKVQLTPRLR
jgi:hypothetical protein